MPGLNALVAFVVGVGLAAVVSFVLTTVASPSATQPDQSHLLLYGTSSDLQ